MLKLGTSDIGQIYLGDTKIAKAYLGNNVVFNGGGQPLPYDSKVEWLYSDGSAYIDTGIQATGDLSVECEFRIGTTANSAIAGAIYNRGSNQYYRTHLSPANTIGYYYNNASQQPFPTAFNTTDFYYFKLDTVLGKATRDNTTINFTPATFDCLCNYGVFARLSVNMALQAKPSYFKYLKLSRGGVLLRDFIAVRVGQVGYMYDKVSGQLFGNDGSGAFTLGNDII